jgi:acylphosphatase
MKIKMTVSGRVQGVGFRWGTQQIASELGVTGSVWNNQDGTVGIQAEHSSPSALHIFEKRIREGSTAFSKVDYVDVTPANFPSHQDFRVTYGPED